MISFKEFLESQESRLRAEKLAAAEAWRKWAESVDALIERIEGWIKDSDPHELVTLNRGLVGDVDEDGFLRKKNLLLQGQRKLACGCDNLYQELVAPPATATLHRHALLSRMLLQ